MTETAEAARPIDLHGELYQRRGYYVLPILVRQAKAGSTIYYSDLAAEMRMPNARNLNWVLGSVATSLVDLGDEWGEPIPPLQAIVVNQADGMPGSGFDHSLVDPSDLANVSSSIRRQIIDGMLANVYAYPKWEQVLAHFGMEAADPPVTRAMLEGAGRGLRGGESDEHREFKNYIAANPHLLRFRGQAAIEYCLPSGDKIDVLFSARNRWMAAEVKSARSPESDQIRGVFQVVKYVALLEAEAAALGCTKHVAGCLALEALCTPPVQRLANLLGVRVVDQIRIPIAGITN